MPLSPCWLPASLAIVLAIVLAACAAPCAIADPGFAAPVLEPATTTGLPTRISAPSLLPPNVLVAPASLTVAEGGKASPAPALTAVGGGAFEGRIAERAVRLRLAYGAARFPFIELTLTNDAATARTLAGTLALPLQPEVDAAFFPAGEWPRVSLRVGGAAVAYAYHGAGQQTAMPLGQVANRGANWGLAFFGEHGQLFVESLTTRITRTEQQTLVALTLDFPCPPGSAVTRRLYFAATRSDWRPALGALLAQFPQPFEPLNPDIAPLQGPFVCSGGTPPDKRIQDWYAQGTRVVEIHGTPPFYGEYVPTRPVWTAFCDDRWSALKKRLPPDQRPAEGAPWRELQAFVEKQEPPTMTLAAVNDYIRRLHTHNMKGLIYFNPTEAWAPWAADQFPRDRALTPAGKPIPVWYESCAMIPDKDRAWGKYLLEQLRGQLRIFPEVDGVFFDQSAGGGHDLTALCAEACRLVRAQGKICWWNGPYNIELAALADGMMSEGGGDARYRHLTEMSQYYAMAGKPIVSLGPATTAAYAEMLAHAVFPQPVGQSNRELGERWSPLFRWLRNQRWVLEADALDALPEMTANLYRVPGDSLVVTLVRNPLPTDATPPVHDVPFTVRVPEAPRVRGAYLLAPDLRGYHKLPLIHEGTTLRVVVPRMGPAAAIVLARKGVFAALEGGLHVVRGHTTPVRWVLDNWSDTPARAVLGVDSPFGGKQAEVEVFPGTTGALTASLAVPANYEPGRAALTTTARVGETEYGGNAELWIDSPLMLTAQAPPRVSDDAPLEVGVRLLSHLGTPADVRVEATSPALRFEVPAQTVAAPADASVTLRFPAKPILSGDAVVRIRATGPGDVTAEAEVAVQVLATALGPTALKHVRAAELLMDVFGVDGGSYAHKPVSINGVAIGDVPPGSGDHWATASPLSLPAEAIRTLQEHNQITIDNTVADAFKVRNLSMRLHLRGGVTAVSGVDRGVYTGWTEWLYGEGKCFAPGQPMTGMAVDIRIDPTRRERYEEPFGTPTEGRLILEVNGADGGPYAHKPVLVNGHLLGDLPGAGDWAEKSLPLTPAALDGLTVGNQVVIQNSDPIDAFKVRRARLEIRNTQGQTFATATDEGAHTSCNWEFAEGTVGSPITIELRFARP